jgi:tellurite resistance protein TehA-like permease
MAVTAVLLAAYLRRERLPYGLGWWAFTFPLGAYTASTLALARAWHAGWLEALAVVLFLVLMVFWVVVALGTARAARFGEVWRR